MYYITKNNIKNAVFIIHFLKVIRFPGYETNQPFLKPYLTLCRILLRNLLTPSQDKIRIQVIDYLFENQKDLFEIAYSVNNHELVSSAYSLLKLIYKIKIENDEKSTTNHINLLTDSKYFEDLIKLCEDDETDIIESKIMFLSVLIPFINQVDKLCLLIDLIPYITDLIGSGSDYRPCILITLILIEKLQPYSDQFNKLIILITENQLTDQVQSIISDENLLDLDSLEMCNIIYQICTDCGILNSE